MIEPTPSDSVASQNEQALRTLERAIRLSEGQFSLILVRCNYIALQQEMMVKLHKLCPFAIHELTLSTSTETLYTVVKAVVKDEQPLALMVFGLESVDDLDGVLSSTNQVRDQFRKDFSFPLILWVNDAVLQKLIRLAPDFESWSTTIGFFLSPEASVRFIQQTTDVVFHAIAQAGAERGNNSSTLNLETCAQSLIELEFVLQDLQQQNVHLEPNLEASLEFVLGQCAYHSMEIAKQHYDRSLQLYHKLDDNKLETNAHPRFLDRQGILLFYIGLWWRRYATLHRAEQEHGYHQAKDYFQQAVDLFQRCDRPDLEARFINALGEILQRLELWQELEQVAQRSLTLQQAVHQTAIPSQEQSSLIEVESDRLIRLAHAYGLLADVALSKSNWDEAKQNAEKALQLLETAHPSELNKTVEDASQTYVWRYYQEFYRRSLSKALFALNQKSDAIEALETARTEGNPQYDPILYTQILRELRDLYFEQKDYLKAFRIRQAYRSIEQQYGFRAFVGAGRLQSQKLLPNPALAVAEQSIVAQEIAASGRQQDVNRLIERVGRSDCKLTVIYGQSGVGKSSILQAGFIPAVSPQTIDTRNVVVVLQQVYANWTAVLGQQMLDALTGRGYTAALKTVDSAPNILEQLHKSADRNLLTVVIFDQFEEFFFIYKDPIQRKPFYDFLKQCLDIPYVKVILSLREDYLHYLLECNRLENLEIINNNILDKNILFYLGNFSKPDAKSVIQSLTNRAQFFLEPDLIDALAEDLAQDLGEIRPIELQVVGSQLQTENITTLATYRQRGPKEELVGRYLEEVIKDCGPENEQVAKLVLYLLTDENNTRPLKTRADLELELDVVSEKLDLVLTILVESRLVFQIPSSPSDRYQLVHDYLVAFVRQQQSARLIAELEKEREQRKLTEAKLNQALTQQLRAARRATFTLVGLVAAIGGFAVIATLVGVNTYLSTLSSRSSQNRELERVTSALKASRQLKQLIGVVPEVQLTTLSELNQAIVDAREVNRLEGHSDEITSIVFSKDNSLIASASKDKTVKIWRIDGTLVATLIGHRSGVTSVSFSPDGKTIVSASEDGMIKTWNTNGTLLETWQGHQAKINIVSFSPDGKTIASGSDDQTVKIWRGNRTLLKTLAGHEVGVTELSFSLNGREIASAGEYDTVKVWDLEGYNLIGELDSYDAIEIKFSPDGQHVNVTGRDATVKSYDSNGTLLTGNFIASGYSSPYLLDVDSSSDSQIVAWIDRFEKNHINTGKLGGYGRIDRITHDDQVSHFVLSLDGKFLVSATQNNRLTIWNLTNEEFHTQNDETQISTMRLSSDGKTVIVNYYGDSNSSSLLQQDGKPITTIPGNSSISSFSPDSQSLITESNDRVATLWSLDDSKVILQQLDPKIRNIAVSPNGQNIGTGNEDGSITIWNDKGERIRTFNGHAETVKRVIFSQDSTMFASFSSDRIIKLWHNNGTLIRSLPEQAEEIEDLIFSPNSKTFTSIGSDGLAKLWRRDGTLITTLIGHTGQVSDVIFSPDGETLATLSRSRYSDTSVKLWRTDGTQLSSIEENNISNVEFNPDGNILATTYYDSGAVKLWDLEGNSIRTLRGHGGGVSDISFSTNGETIATASEDNTVRLWDQEGNIIRVLRGHSNAVTGVEFNPFGKVLASVDSNNTVKLWSAGGQEIQTLQKSDADSNSDSRSYGQIMFSSDGETIILTSYKFNARGRSSYTVTLWDRSGEEIYRYRGQSESINITSNSQNISSDGRVAVFTSQDLALKLWSLDGQLLKTFEGHTDWVNSVSFSPNGEMIASASDDETIRLWNRDGTLLETLEGHDGRVNSVSFSSGGETIASASDDRTVKLWSIEGQLLQTIDHTDKVTSVLFHPTDNNTVASALSDGTVTLWRVSDGQEIDTFKFTSDPYSPNRYSSDELDALSFSADGNILALGTRQVSLRLLDAWFIKNATFQAVDVFPEQGLAAYDDAITVRGNSGTIVLTLGLDDLLSKGCEWAGNYLRTNPSVEEGDRHLCDDIP